MTSTPFQGHGRQFRRQHGLMLLEVLIAVVVFSIGVLSVVKLNAMAAKQSTEAEFRSIASLAVNDLVSRIWASSHKIDDLQKNLSKNNSSGASSNIYSNWYKSTLLKSGLPGVDTYPPDISVATSVYASSATQVLITVYWKMPGKDWDANERPHSYTVTVVLR